MRFRAEGALVACRVISCHGKVAGRSGGEVADRDGRLRSGVLGVRAVTRGRSPENDIAGHRWVEQESHASETVCAPSWAPPQITATKSNSHRAMRRKAGNAAVALLLFMQRCFTGRLASLSMQGMTNEVDIACGLKSISASARSAGARDARLKIADLCLLWSRRVGSGSVRHYERDPPKQIRAAQFDRRWFIMARD